MVRAIPPEDRVPFPPMLDADTQMPPTDELARTYRLCERLQKALTEMREQRAFDLETIERLTKENIGLKLRNDDLEKHRCSLPDSIQQALNSGDGVYRP